MKKIKSYKECPPPDPPPLAGRMKASFCSSDEVHLERQREALTGSETKRTGIIGWTTQAVVGRLAAL